MAYTKSKLFFVALLQYVFAQFHGILIRGYKGALTKKISADFAIFKYVNKFFPREE
jgi:hypothetical protein